MNRMFVSAVALLALAGAAHAQNVTLGFRPRVTSLATGTSAGVNEVLDIAITATVTGGRALAGFDFDLGIAGEAESRGVFQIARISDNGKTYTPNTDPWEAIGNGVAAGVTEFGIAPSYSYLPGLQAPKFNGNINESIGTFTDNPAEQEIGLIGGLTSGSSLLRTPGVDPSLRGNPQTWPGYSTSGATPVNHPEFGTTAALAATPGATYFAVGTTIDIYHFQYTVTDFTARDLVFQIRNAHASTFSHFEYSLANNIWGIDSAAENSVNTNSFTIHVTPAPSSVALMGLGGLVAIRRRRA